MILLRRGSVCETPCSIAFVRPQSVVGGEDILRLLTIAADAVDPCPVWEPHGVVKKTFIQVRLLLIPLRVGRRLCRPTWNITLNPVSGWKSAGPKTPVLYPSPFLQKSNPLWTFFPCKYRLGTATTMVSPTKVLKRMKNIPYCMQVTILYCNFLLRAQKSGTSVHTTCDVVGPL